MNISICCPSFRRPKVETLNRYPDVKVYIDETEADNYIAANPNANIVPVASEHQGNLCRIRNYILDTEFDQGFDVVLIVDDDIEGIYRWNRKGTFGYDRTMVTMDGLVDLVAHGSMLCSEWGYKFWGIGLSRNKLICRHSQPFSTTQYIGGPFQCHLRNDIRYDERLPLKEDYDITMQHLLRNGGALRMNMYHCEVKRATNTGGCSQYRNTKREQEQMELLQRKWGKDVFKYDNSSVRSHDFNPRMRSPIRGV